MADKHILRIHDTQANLLADLKDTQIAWATDTEEAIWRDGNKFHFLGSGKYWDGTQFVFDNVDVGEVSFFDKTSGSILGKMTADGGNFTIDFNGIDISIDSASLDLTAVTSITATDPTQDQQVATKKYVDDNTGTSFYTQTFVEADLVARILTITHNLDSEDILLTLFDADKKVYIPDEYQVIDANNVEVTIDATVVGTNKIVACANAQVGAQNPPSVGGFMDYNDTSTTSTPINLSADTWTTIPNDGLGAFTNKTYRPDGNSIELIDTATGSIDTTGLSLGDTILIRNDFTVVPNTNNASLLFRYQLGSGAGSYTLEKRLGRLDEGSGSPYRFSLSPDLIYMGDTNTKNNPISLQVKLSTGGTLVNAGSVIQLISYYKA
jgi:hypothetical protein